MEAASSEISPDDREQYQRGLKMIAGRSEAGLTLATLVLKVNRIIDQALRDAEFELLKKESGVMLLEFALLTPILLTLIMGGLDVARCTGAKNSITWLVTQAVTCQQVQGNACDPLQFISNSAQGLSLDPSQLQTTIEGKTVQLQYHYQPISAVFPPVTLTAVAVGP